MDFQESTNWLDNIAQKQVDTWFVLQIHNPFTHYYLYFKRGNFVITDEKLEGYVLATGQRISPSWTCRQAKQFVIDIMRKLPCLPE